MQVVVVGAGFGGIASAALLAKRGAHVKVVERLSTPGGRARTTAIEGFKFDMGPSWYLMPEVFERFFNELGYSVSQFYEITKLKPSFRLKVNGASLDVPPGDELFSTVEHVERGAGETMREYLEMTKYMYDVSLSKFLYREFQSFVDFLDPQVIREARRLNLFTSLNYLNSKYFKSDLLRKLTGFSAVFLGGDPYSVPGMYAMVNYPVLGQGMFYPRGGFGKVVESMVEAGRKLGVEFQFDTEVTGVLTDDQRVKALQTSKGRIEGDVFLFNADYVHAESLLPERYRNFGASYWDSKVLAPSAVLGYVGIKGELDVPHHNVIVNGDWGEHFKSIREGKWPRTESTSYYVSVRSRSDPSVCPEGNEALFFLIPISPGLRGREEEMVKWAVRNFLGKREVSFIRIFGPRDFWNDYRSYKGTAFGLAHTLSQTASLRPPMKNKKLRNVYYVGQYTHPGVGVPMVAIAAHVVSQRILADLKK